MKKKKPKKGRSNLKRPPTLESLHDLFEHLNDCSEDQEDTAWQVITKCVELIVERRAWFREKDSKALIDRNLTKNPEEAIESFA